MKVGDLIRFKKTGVLGTVISVVTGEYWVEVKVLHNCESVANPTGFAMVSLLESTEVLSEIQGDMT